MPKANYSTPAWLARLSDINGVVRVINNYREMFGAQCVEDYASTYAIDCELSKLEKQLIKANLSAHLDELLEKGAKFSKRKATKSINEDCKRFGISLR